MVDVQLQVKTRGPIFDGRADAAVDDFVSDAVDAIAQDGVNEVREQLDRVLRNPTGAYSSRIQTDRRSRHRELVTDGGVIYGPWLAGTSSRNQTTSFKGYRHWQRATQELQQRADHIAEQELPPHLARMNG